MKTTHITDDLKKEVFKRDNFTCQYCEKKKSEADLVLDHLEPLSSGGTNDKDNLVTSCQLCNRQKGAKTLDDFFAEKERETKAKRVWAWSSIVVATAGMIFSVFAAFVSDIPSIKSKSTLENKINDELNRLEQRISSQEQQTNNVIKELKNAISTNNVSSQAILEKNIELVEKRLSSLETSLSASPEKALSIPLLRKDISSLEKSVDSDMTMLKREVDRIYDQSKWFIGLMVTMLLTLIGLAVSTLVSTNKKN